MTIAEVHKTYVENVPALGAAAETLEGLLEHLTRDVGVSSSIEVRAKTVASFVKKCVGPKAYKDPWNEVTDKVGARIVVENRAALKKLLSAIEAGAAAHLSPTDPDDKSESNDPNALYYPGIHLQIIVPGHVLSTGEPVEAELQLRTKAQDLWATTSHKLDYKGVVPLSRQSKRRIWRLSVLTEMFDEEVERVINELATDSSYDSARYLQLAEAEFLRVVPQPGNDELSLIVLDAIRPAIGDTPEEYEDVLHSFAGAYETKLARIYEDYGPQSVWAAEFNYWMFSQPESVIAFQLIDTCPAVLADLVVGSDLEAPFRELFSLWGQPLPSE